MNPGGRSAVECRTRNRFEPGFESQFATISKIGHFCLLPNTIIKKSAKHCYCIFFYEDAGDLMKVLDVGDFEFFITVTMK